MSPAHVAAAKSIKNAVVNKATSLSVLAISPGPLHVCLAGSQ